MSGTFDHSTPLLFEIQSLTELKVQLFYYVGWPINTRNLPVSASTAMPGFYLDSRDSNSGPCIGVVGI